ncbi:hypothetical protein NE236_40565 [Actinoallomurus purpureus]|uniref:hypothetical protein n=1 Tax=Actinoallomurus purpureus TaxID=478114 RepID=UPI002091FB8A|nr:hypothetical protein [Actinoallomurus purpureus]MCO6011262.1 hypothetical protein [Actinoallomurus purpureus]
MRNKQLTASERKLAEAFSTGRRLTLGSGDPGRGATWGPDRTIRAEVVRELLVSATPPSRAGVPAVRITGARIVGTLDLRFASVTHPLSLRSCHMTGMLDLHGVRSREIDLRGSHLREGLYASTAFIDGHLLLTDTVIDKTVRLIATHIAGALFMNGARLGDPGGGPGRPVFEADRLQVDADLLCRDGFRANGEIRFPGARIGDSIDFEGATLSNPKACALAAPRIVVGGDFLARNAFSANGSIDVDGATVEGQLNLDGARLSNPGGYALRGARLTVQGEMRCTGDFTAHGELHLLNARIVGPLILDGARILNPHRIGLHASGLTADGMYCRDDFTVEGSVRLSGARITGPLDFSRACFKDDSALSLGCWWLTARELILRPAVPPGGTVDLRYAQLGLLEYAPGALPGTLRLDGLTYNAIAPSTSVNAGLAWLDRTPPGFRPQPYEQLAETYRRTGNDAYARNVLLAKERRRRSGLPLPIRVWGYLQDATVGYGYRPWRAAGWLALMLIVGTVAFHTRHPLAAEPGKAPPFNAFIYTLDLLLPIIDLGQRKAYLPPAGWLQWLMYGFVVLGWVLATTIAAGITRALRRQ